MLRRTFAISLPVWWADVQAASFQQVLVGDTAPFSFKGPDNNFHGVVYDVVEEASKLLPISLKPKLVPFKRAFFELPQSAHNLIMPPARIPSREKLVKWIEPIAIARLMVITRANFKGNVSDIESARKLSIGSLSAPGLEDLFHDLGFQNIQQIATNEVALNMLMAERFDAVLTIDCSIYYLMKQLGLDTSTLREGVVIRSVEMWLGASLGFPDSDADAWRKAIRTLKKNRGLIGQIFARYGAGSGSMAA